MNNPFIRKPPAGFVPMPAAPAPAAPVAAPASPPLAPDDGTTETFSKQFPYPAGELLVFSTARRWSGCDVYIATSKQTPAVLTVRVYARVGGLRVLVATGRSWRGDAGAGPGQYEPQAPAWVAAARGAAVQYDVTVSSDFTGTTPDPATFAVAVVASDRLVVPPYDLGSVAFETANVFDSLSSPGLLGYGGPKQDLELLDVWATVRVAQASGQWLMVFDRPAGLGPANGDIPTLSFPVAGPDGVAGDQKGKGARYVGLNYRQRQTRLTVRASSTPTLLTISTSCTFGVKVR